MNKVVCFGELLMRFTPSLSGDWLQKSNMPVFVGGAEANVASALSKWDVPVSFMSVVPDHFLGHQLLGFLKDKGIDTSSVLRTGNRMGTYYLPAGVDLKNSAVIYDRQNSSFSDLKPGMIDWDSVLDGADWFHFSAICPAINQNVADVCEEALKVAISKNIQISVDLNYRSKLWQYGKNPAEVMPQLVSYCDLVMGNVWAAEQMLNIPLSEELNKDKKSVYLEQANRTSEAIIKNFPLCKTVANTYRFTDGEKINYYAVLYDHKTLYHSAEYDTDSIVDKVGSGDCFMAGLIYGYKNHLQPQEIIDFATAAAFQKLFVKGDSIDRSVEEIQQTINQL